MKKHEVLARDLWEIKREYAIKKFNCDIGEFGSLSEQDQKIEIAGAKWIRRHRKVVKRSHDAADLEA